MNAQQLGRIIKQDGETVAKAQGRAAEWAVSINEAMAAFGIVTKAQQAAFLAQICLESAGLTRLVENLNYSAHGLANTWPSRYALKNVSGKVTLPVTPNALALSLHRKPEAIANNCYANRMGNGSEASGDGFAFRGRGAKQLTGRANYAAAGKALGADFITQPGLVATPKYAALTAAWFWASNNLNALADRGDFAGLTKAINGGLNGHDDGDRRDFDTRVDYWIRAKEVLA